MINRRLTSREAAARLGVKPATLYSYVSRGLLHPERSSRGSTYDIHEVIRLARTSRHPTGPAAPLTRRPAEGGPEDPMFVTELTLIDGGRLYYRGLDAIELSRSRSFEEVAVWLWTGEWGGPRWVVPPGTRQPLRGAIQSLPAQATPLERFGAAVMTASLCDELRHDLNPAGVPVTARALLATLAAALPRASQLDDTVDAAVSARVWAGLTESPASVPALRAVEAALVLAADHELAPSTMAARVAASFRADPYAVVLTGFGPASGSWQAGSTGAPSEVEALLREAADIGVERAVGHRLRRVGDVPHGFGMPLYPAGDPRGAELLDRLDGVGPSDRLDVVRRLIEVGVERGFPPPNFDLGLGALSFCAGMVPGAGQAIFTLGKVAGWLGHAIEEYTSPTRFRSRADYVGPAPVEGAPDSDDADEDVDVGAGPESVSVSPPSA